MAFTPNFGHKWFVINSFFRKAFAEIKYTMYSWKKFFNYLFISCMDSSKVVIIYKKHLGALCG